MKSPWNGKKVLVTGGTGFIGSFLVEWFLDRGASVRVPLRAQNYRALSSRRGEVDWMEGDLRDPAYCTRLVTGVNHVFHLAGSRRNTEFHLKKPSDVANDNVRMSLALIDALKEAGAPVPVTFLSTANVPPAIDTVELSQKESVDGYVLGKALCETLWLMAAHQRKFPVLVVRAVGAYGPRDTFSEDANLIPALMLQARDKKDAMTVWGDGSQERAFLYVEDLVDVMMKLVEANATDIQYVTTDDVVTVKDVAELIRDTVRPGLPIQFNPEKDVAPRAKPQLPVHEAVRDYEWTPLAEGLKNTNDWWKS